MNTTTHNESLEGNPQQGALFEMPLSEDVVQASATVLPGGVPRLRKPNRLQRECLPYALDELLPKDHPVRAIWAYVEGLDFAPLTDKLRSVEGSAGRSTIDPRICTTLWLFATAEGVGSARQLERLCERDIVYRWICGGVSVNYHTLADFRTAHPDFLDLQLTRGVAALMHEGLVELKRVAQDGMRVRADAGAASFRRRPSLEKCLAAAEEQMRQLKEELQADPSAGNRRQQAARERADRERRERVQKALDRLPEMEAKKKPSDKGEARTSTTDPEATVMKMGDGGFRPAYNVQFSTDTASQIITGMEVVINGSDHGQLAPMMEQHQERYEQRPDEALVDGGFVAKEDITTVTANGTTVYAPVPKPKKSERDPHVPLADDNSAMAEWRVRMGTTEAKEIYKERAATAECVNALARNRGLQRFRVRGRVKVRTVALWYALVQNVLRALTLRAALAAEDG